MLTDKEISYSLALNLLAKPVAEEKTAKLVTVVIMAENGKDSVPNAVAVSKLTAHRCYNSDGNQTPDGLYRFTTDRHGRVTRASGRVVYNPGPRAEPPTPPGMRPGDHRGHLIAHANGGPNVVDNIVPMHPSLNRGEYQAMERTLRDAAMKGSNVEITVRPRYRGRSRRPYQIDVEAGIDGRRMRWRFNNPCP